MDHTKLHKPNNARRNADDHKAEKSRRRSIVQKQKRGQILEKKRDLSPLRETTNIPKQKTGDMKSKLEIWKKEREIKKRKDRIKSKPVFKVSSNIERDDNKFTSSRAKTTSKSKENHPTSSTASNLNVEKKHVNLVARVTRSKATNSKIPSGAANKKKTVMNKAKLSKSLDKENKIEKTNGSKKDKSLVKESKTSDGENTQEKSQHNSQSEEKSSAHETVPNPAEDSRKDFNPAIRINSDTDPLSESFAPANFTFKAPVGLKKFSFSTNVPNSNESFVYSSKGGPVNFSCSTPLTIPAPEQHKKTPVPMVLSSASGTSDDENTNQTTIQAKSQNNEDKEKEEKVQSFRNLVITESKALTMNCEEWEEIQENNKNVLTEEVVGEIRTVIGQAQLLMAERFDQFSKLIDKYEKPSPDHNPVNPTDLKGFWEMIYYQVDDVKNKFKNLKTLQANNWEKPQSTKKKVTRKRKASTAAKGSSAHRRAARKRIKEAREAMKAKLQEEEKDTDDKEEQEPPAKSCKQMPSTSRTISGDDISSQDDESGPVTRSRRKTPGGKNVSFATTPRSKKRKAGFGFESPDSEQKDKTPGSQPRKRVMRKTPLPGPRPDSTLKDGEGNASSNEDVQASPSLKMNRSNELDASSTDIADEGEIKGVKLNFDDVESDNENNQNSIDMKYLLPSECEETAAEKSESNNEAGIDMKYLKASETDSPSSSLVSTLTINKTCTDSPGRILRSKRKSHHNPMSPFLKPSCQSNEVSQPANDLMSFSPLPTAEDENKTGSSQNANFALPVRKSSRLLSRLDSLEYDAEGNQLDINQGNAVGLNLIPSLL